MEHDRYAYGDAFFDHVDRGAKSSADVIVRCLQTGLRPESVVDVGCGRGVWCAAWMAAGVSDVVGVDGDYVEIGDLAIPAELFVAHDLARPFELGRRFDLVMSLEVGEHLPASSADAFVNSLAWHGDVVLFSAAVPGQGGAFHVNEQPREYWRDKFAERGYRCFDWIRPKLAAERSVKPWYRYNTLLFVADARADDLAAEIRATEVPRGDPIPERAPWAWRARNATLGLLPAVVVHRMSLAKHAAARLM